MQGPGEEASAPPIASPDPSSQHHPLQQHHHQPPPQHPPQQHQQQPSHLPSLQQIQHIAETGQFNDPRYLQLISFLQAQHAQQAISSIQASGGVNGGTGEGPSAPLLQRLQQDVASRSNGDTHLGVSDSSHNIQSHSQAAFHARLAAQHKAQTNAFTHHNALNPLRTGDIREFNAANNPKLQELVHQQLAGRQPQQLAQTGPVKGGQSTSSEKLRNPAHTGSQQQLSTQSTTLNYLHGSSNQPVPGPLQGVQSHQAQQIQNNMSPQINIMASPLQQSTSPVPPNTPQPPPGAIPLQFLSQYPTHLVGIPKAAGQIGVVMDQSRTMVVSGSQLTPATDQVQSGVVGGGHSLKTSSRLTAGGFSNSVAMPVYHYNMHGGTPSIPVGLNPDMNSNFVKYHALPPAGGDSRASLSAKVQANSGGHVLESSTLGAAGGEAADRANSSMQHVEQLAHSSMSRSSTSLGVAGEGPAPAQQSRHPPLGYGFSKYQLTLLRNQILAFKKLRTRKPGEVIISDEIKRLINPSRSSQHTAQSVVTSSSRESLPGANVKPPELVGKVSEPPLIAPDNDNKSKIMLVPKDSGTLQNVENKNEGLQAGGIPPVSVLHAVNNGDRWGALSAGTQVKPEAGIQFGGTIKSEAKDTDPIQVDAVKGTKVGASTNSTVRTMVAPAVMTPSIQKVPHVLYRGPLFSFPPVSKRFDGGALSMTPQASCWGPAISLGYKVRELLLEEGVRVIDKKRADKLKVIADVLKSGKGKKVLLSNQLVKLRTEEKRLKLVEFQARIRDEVEEQQQEIMDMGERAYRKFVRLCERQRLDLSRQVMLLQRSSREKHLKSLFQWRKKILEAQWVSRDARVTRNRGVSKCHERMLRDYSKRKDEDRNKRMEALKNNDVDAYREMLKQQQGQLPGDAGERFEVLSSFLTQTEEYLHKLGGKISAVKNHQEREEAAVAAAAAARAQGYSEEEVQEAALRAGEEASAIGYVTRAPVDTSVNKYYSLAHAVHEKIIRQPSMLRAGTLRDYQMVGLQWMLSLYNNRLNGILADEMGLGKTVQVMALIAYLMEYKGNYGPHLIIVPNAVIVNWKSELLRWLPSVSCIYYVGHKDQRAKIFAQDVCAMKFNVLVTTYEFIMRDRAKLSKVEWKYIIIDEAQRMKDRESRLARDLDRFRCHRRLLLTGTPLQNDLHELWSLLNLLLPEVFDNSKSFHEWFAKPFQKETSQSEEDDWLETEKKVIVIHRLHQILEPFMLRRRVEDVEGSLPPKVSVVLKCKMSAYQASIYDWVKTTGTLRLDPDDEAQRIAGNTNRLARAYAPLQNKCMELRKVCNHPYLNYPPRYHVQSEQTVRACGKLWILDRILVKLHKTGHRVLLFSTMTRLLDILEDYLQWRRLSYRRIDGMTTLEARESAIVEFNRPGSDCFIFLLSIRAAGRGLNLQTADTVIVYDPDPNPKNEEQAVARAHRIGQKREVRVIYMEAVVESVPSYEKEDVLRSGGSLEEDEDEMAGKDRYVGSVESLVRNNIQQHKIDMADEVINAGRFDQRTTQEERRLTLEALLHDEERYQQTVHDVPTLQEVNRMIARTDEELELFDRMDEEFNWAGELLSHKKVPKWLRVGSREVNAAVDATSKEAMKKGFQGTVGTQEAEDQLLTQVAKGPLAIKALGKRSKSTNKYKNYREVEINDDFFPEEEAEEVEEEEQDSVIAEVLTAANFDDDVDDEVEPQRGAQDEAKADQNGEDFEEEEVIEMIEEVEELEEEEEEEEDGAEAEEDEEEEEEDEEAAVFPHIPAYDEGEVVHAKSRRGTSDSHLKKFASLSALESRPSRPEESDDLEEGEIAASGESEQHSESWIFEHEGAEEAAEEEENEHTVQHQNKRKRSRSHYRHPVHPDGLGERETSNGSFTGREKTLSLSRMDHSPLQRSNFGRLSTGPQLYNRSGPLNSTAKKRSATPLEAPPARPRIVFKQNWGNGLQEAAGEPLVGRENRTLGTHSGGLPGSRGGGGGRLLEGQQKKCKAVLGKLHGAVNKDGRQIAELFMELPKRSEMPDYYKVIARPISAQAIEERLDRFDYPSVSEFAADVHLMIDNAARYHSDSLEIVTHTYVYYKEAMDQVGMFSLSMYNGGNMWVSDNLAIKARGPVQADARRLQALFQQRMGLHFPEINFASTRVRLPHGSETPRQPAVVITGPRGLRRQPPPPIDSEATRPMYSEPHHPQIMPRVAAAAAQQHQQHMASAFQHEEPSNKKDSKRSRKAGKGKVKVVMSNSKARNAVVNDKAPPVVVEDAGPADEGILHPVDLVIHKKKRKCREQTTSRISQLVVSKETTGNLAQWSSSVGVSSTDHMHSRSSRQSAGLGSKSLQGAVATSVSSQIGAVTVLKKSRTDGGKRRPTHR